MKVKKLDIGFLLLLVGISILSIDLLINPSHRELIENISRYPPFQNLLIGLLTTFWVCLIGNLLPIPTPYTFVVCFSSQPFLQLNIFIPLLIGIVASLGCLVGEMGGYLVGRGAFKIISEERRSNLKRYQQYLIEHPKTAPFLLYLFGLTPLNDDMVTIPLGLIKYNIKKTIFWVWLGKLSLMLIFAYNLANICIFIGGESWIISIISLYIIVILVYLLLRVDIMELLSKGHIKRNINS